VNLIDLRYQKERRSPEELLRHLGSFNLEIKPSVGIWYFGASASRFHETYGESFTIEQRIEMAAEMAKFGVKGIEAHYPTEVNEENLYLYQQLEKEAGIKLIGIGPFSFFYRDFEFGTISNPYKISRDKAYKMMVGALRLARDAGANGMGLWPGIDGYTVSYGHHYYDMWDHYEEALAAALDEVPGMRVNIETKPYEPIPNNIYRTTADGLLLAHDVESRLKNPENKKLLAEGHSLVGMQPEIGHIRMGYEDTPYVFSRIMREGRLGHTHWNSQPLGNYDQDLNIGVTEIQQAEAALYALKMYGYRDYFGIDINPERMPVMKAVEINCNALSIMNERINELPHERILDCYFDPANHRGDLEMILLEGLRKNR
jgi:xylose isomerase